VNGELFQQLLVNGLVLGAFYALLGLSWNLIYATTRIFHFAHALVFVIAAYGAVLLVERGVPLLPALLVGVLVGGAAGVLCEVAIYRPLRAHGSTPLSLFLASMGLTVAGANAMQLIVGPQNRSLGEGVPDRTFTIGAATFSAVDLIMTAAAVVVFGLVLLLERRTTWGHAMSAVRTNADMATAVGISVERVFVFVFFAGSLVLGVGSMYFVADNAASPAMGVSPIIAGLIAMFLGGIGNSVGVALGGLVTGLSQNLGGLWIPGDYQVIVSFVLLMVILVVRPQGLLGQAPR
jgi:branched-chain amino acid transport system permease protein